MPIPPSKSQVLAQTRVEARWHTYNKRVPGGLSLLVSFSGSGIPRALPFGVIAGVYALLLEKYADIGGFGLFEHTYPFHVIAFITGFGLIFRLNIAYQRFWEARGLTQNMAAKWADAALQVIAFDEVAEGAAAESSSAFIAYAVHAFSLLHAVALQSLRGDAVERALRPVPLKEAMGGSGGADASLASAGGGLASAAVAVSIDERDPAHFSCGGLCPHAKLYPRLDVLGGLSAAEAAAISASDERTHLVYTWLLKELVTRRKAGGLATDAPVVSRIYQVLSDGMLGYLGARKLADTPFPFPYAQLNAAFCVVNLCVFPAVVAAKVQGLAMVTTIAFLAITMMYSLNEVARELEDPYTAELGSSANRLQAAAMHADFNNRLLTFYHSGRGRMLGAAAVASKADA